MEYSSARTTPSIAPTIPITRFANIRPMAVCCWTLGPAANRRIRERPAWTSARFGEAARLSIIPPTWCFPRRRNVRQRRLRQRTHPQIRGGRTAACFVGEPGSGPGQFHIPHGIAVDRQGKVYVADRENSRIQLFSPDGKYLSAWTDVARPARSSSIADDTVYVAELGFQAGMWPGPRRRSSEATGGRVSIFDARGQLYARWAAGRQSYRGGRFLRPAWDLRRFARRSLRSRGRDVGGGQPRPGCAYVPCVAEIRSPNGRYRAENHPMKAWRFMGLMTCASTTCPSPACPAGHVLVEPLWRATSGGRNLGASGSRKNLIPFLLIGLSPHSHPYQMNMVRHQQ